MRLLFLLLLLANVGFYAYGLVGAERAGADPQFHLLEINRDKIKIMKERGEAPAKDQEARARMAICVEWAVLAGSDLARADAALAALALPPSMIERTVTDAGGYWVYLPPAKSKSQLDRNISQLTSLGVTEFFVVQEGSAWRNAISLGIFKNEDAAKVFLESLRAKGLQSAVAERREKFLKQIAYYLREPSDATIAKLAQLQRDFPGTRIRAVACPPAAAGN